MVVLVLGHLEGSMQGLIVPDSEGFLEVEHCLIPVSWCVPRGRGEVVVISVACVEKDIEVCKEWLVKVNLKKINIDILYI